MKIPAIVFIILFIAAGAVLAEEKAMVCQPQAIGFYPSEKAQLGNMVDGFLENAAKKTIEGELIGIMAPHAGYAYSGQVAAYAYKQLEGLEFDTVVIIGSCHRKSFRGVSMGRFDHYRTPLGDVPVDLEVVERLERSAKNIFFYKPAFEGEHSLEVQIPFLQKTLKNFKVVLLLFGENSLASIQETADAVFESTKGRKTLFVASTDLSHYYSYNQAIQLDRAALASVLGMDADKLFIDSSTGSFEMCGMAAVSCVMKLCQKAGADKAILLNYANSGDVTGQKGEVVGYASAAFTKTDRSQAGDIIPLDEPSQKELLDIARQSIESYVLYGVMPELDVDNPLLNQKTGVFVTLLTKNGQLRGCIGCHGADQPLCKTVSEMAVSSAVNDPRFGPLTKKELDNIKIKVSVYLCKPRRIKSLDEFEPGKHGIILKKGLYEATFLPEVATEQGWDKRRTLEYLSEKAGLPGDAYKRNCEFYIYETQRFGED